MFFGFIFSHSTKQQRVILTESESPEFANDIIPGYENDYLFLDDDDEQIEEDVSDDEGDNYFQVDEDFDDYLMNNNGYDGYPTFNNYESSGNNTDIINNNNNIVDETISDANSNSELEVVLINQRKYHLQPFHLHLQIRMI